MAGILTINFNSLPASGNTFSVDLKYLNSSGFYDHIFLRYDCVPTRTRNGEVTIGTSVEQFTRNFVNAFNADHRDTGGGGNLRATIIDIDSVELSVFNPSWEFVGISGGVSFISFTLNNETTETPKTLKFNSYDYALSTCASPVAEFALTGGSGTYRAYVDGVMVVDSLPSPMRLTLSRDRQSAYALSFTDSTGLGIGSTSFKTPARISADKIKVSIFYTDQGATISVNVDFVSSHIMPLTYSLNGTSYNEENVFTGQLEGDYTVYVKDAFGCVTTKNFSVDGFSTTTETNFSISDINPIRYAFVEPGKKNRYNTLSHEQLKNVAYPYIQYFTDEDQPITQFKTNAQYINVFALDCEGATYPLAPVKRSNHLGQSFKSTATKFATSDNQLGVYFGVVDVLDILSGDIIESKDFGYQVPYAFNNIDGFVNLEGMGLVAIDSIVYDEAYEAFVLVFNIAYSGAETTITVESKYNIQNYEIYEFVTPIVQLPDEFNVVEVGKSAAEIEFTVISERIEKTVDSDKLAEIIYWHTKNLGGMNYATGVVHTLRLPDTLSRLADTQTVEGYNGDVERYITDNEVFDGEEFIFNYLSEEMVRKLRLILTHDRLFINGVLYRLSDEVPELNSRFTTNFCELTAVLRKGGDLTESFDRDVIENIPGEGVDKSTYELEQAIAAAKGKALILWKK